MARTFLYFLTAAVFGPAWFLALWLWPPTNELFRSPGLLIPVASPLRPAIALSLTSIAVAVPLRALLRSGSRGAVIAGALCCLWGAAALFVPIWMLVELVAGRMAYEGALAVFGMLSLGALMGATVGTVSSLPISLAVGALEFLALRTVAARESSGAPRSA